MPTLSGAVVGALPPARAGLGSGLNSAAREIGSALGVAAMGTALAGRAPVPGRPATVDAFTDGMATGFLAAAAGLAVASAAVLAWFGSARAGDPA
jgi:hypothetical protein